MVTTSFGTTSVLLLHIMNRVRKDFPIHFIDTGYLFPETYEYKDQLTRMFDLNIITHKPDPEFHQESKRNELWRLNPDLCCSYNKVEPMEALKPNYEVWISGLIGYQNSYRTGLDILQKRKGIFRFYPLIDWSEAQVNDYMDYFGLPHHPLERMGFASVGCTHCTLKGAGREGRWVGTDKSECGLHL